MSVYLYFAIRYNIYVEVATKRLLLTLYRISNTTTSTPIKERAFVVYGRKRGFGQFVGGHRVAAQPYLINE